MTSIKQSRGKRALKAELTADAMAGRHPGRGPEKNRAKSGPGTAS